MSLPANIDEYQLNLFASADEMRDRNLPDHVVKRLLRLRALYTFWLNFPMKSTREMVQQDQIMHSGVGQREAYDDIKLVKILIGNIEAESKEWHRHVFNRRTEEVFRSAMRNGDYRAAEKANADYAKYNRVGEIDQQPVNYDEIQPHVIEPTDDPTVIGIAPVKDLRGKIAKLKRKFGADIQDGDFIEIKDDGNTEETNLS
ncbi:MAG: hypothetical protein ACI37N_03195 [Prevotella sp.]